MYNYNIIVVLVLTPFYLLVSAVVEYAADRDDPEQNLQ